ncbi:hypothetical protein CC79DRAFT_459318 [Sarocladium strictum]
MGRSHFGCSMCKLRKLKCDEKKPICGPCTRASRHCDYPSSSVFRSFNGSLTDVQGDDSTGCSGSLFDESTVWLQVPHQLVFVHIEDPFNDDAFSWSPEAQLDELPSVSGTLDHGIIAPDDHEFFLTSTIEEEPVALSLGPPEDSSDLKIFQAQLMRYFSEGPGRWIDMFDTTAFFSTKAPSIATTSPLLKAAACALAAKYLSKSAHLPSTTSSLHTLAASLSPACHTSAEDLWAYHASQYQDRALAELKKAEATIGFVNGPVNIAATVAILSGLELIDGPTQQPALLEALSLFGSEDSTKTFFQSVMDHSSVRGPVFCNLARLEFSCAFASERQTRLSLDDTAFWQAAGLALDDNGFLLPGSPRTRDEVDLQTFQDDARANELLWLLAKVFNFLTAGDAMFPEDYGLPPDRRLPLGITQEQLLEKWLALTEEFLAWKSSLPSTFAATARTSTSYLPSSIGCPSHLIEQVWYELPICAAVMQVYHMASILLLTNQPQESTAIRSTLAARLRSYRTVQNAVLMHAREIRGISLALPSDAVRVHSILPLFVAGQVFYELQDRADIEGLLISIENDLGCATKHYRDRLRQEWDQELAP